MGLPHILFCFCLLLCVTKHFVTSDALTADVTTLQYVTAVFRHGEQTMDAATAYPKDPYLNETYYPYGVGQLTSRGKEREYALGQALRKRYEGFIGNIYHPDILDAISSDMHRSKTSLQLVLAGLCPPQGNIMEWNTKLNWQPISYKHADFEKDIDFTVSIYFCPNYAKEYNSYLTNGDGKTIQAKYNKLYEYLQTNTGLNIRRTMEIFFVYGALQAQTEWGLALPDWTRSVWPEKLTEATIDGLASSVATTKLKQLSGGPLVKKITETMKAKANNTLQPEGRKITLYSGHDLNIAYLLGALNLFNPHIIPYGACVLIELHKIGSEHYVKILYEDNTADEPKVLTVPGCDQLCPLSKFESLVKPNYPEKDNPCGDDVTVFEDNQQQREYYKGNVQYKTLIGKYVDWTVNLQLNIVKGVFSFGGSLIDKAIHVDTSNLNILGKGKEVLDKFPRPFSRL